MSHIYYNKTWAEAQSAIQDLLQQEKPAQPPKPEKDRVAAFQLLATMYIKYIQIFRKLEASYDQVVHPQKRRVLRHVLDGTMGRIIELKKEMVDLEKCDFQWFDDVLSDLKLTPNDVEMPIPKYFVNERMKSLKEREKLMGQILAKIGPQDKVQEKVEVKMSMEEAIRLIQIHERARQGRLRAKFMRDIRQQEERERLAATRGVPTLDPDIAATRIEKIWKGFAQRRRTKMEREEEMLFIGMAPPPMPTNLKTTPQAVASKTEVKRRETQDVHEQEYQQALVTVKDKLREVEGPDMKETMMDQIRQWFIECRDALGKFPDFPDEDDGGSENIFKQKDPAELERELREQEEGKDKKGKGKGKGKKEKKKKKEKKEKKGKGKKGKKGKDEEDEGWLMQPSSFIPAIDEGTVTYKTIWEPRDETDNFPQKHDPELIKEEKRVELEKEIRVQVDELMREELKNLKLAVDRDKGKKGKKKKGKKKKKKKGKKGKKKGGKDLTPDRTIESLYEELVSEGIIKRTNTVHMPEYIGEFNYLGTTLLMSDQQPQASLSDVRRTVTEYAILPLGSPAVHEKGPLMRSMLLAGPHGTGKSMVVNVICTETGANLFDLSATNIMGKYPGKDGLKLLLHMVFKVGRALQPSVIFIDECEKMFKKKTPKGDTSDPKRLKKDLPKLLKTIKGEDRLMLIGCTSAPFEAEMKPFVNLYEKRLVLIPRPDYASRHLMWRMFIHRFNGILSNSLDISSLAKVTDGYTPGHMITVCEQVLTDRRINQQSKKPLQAVEFIASLARLEPIYKEEEEAYQDWYKKTPLGKARAKLAAGDDDDGGKGKKGKGGKKGSGKKGKKKK